jgi:signal transduction histidine kinase
MVADRMEEQLLLSSTLPAHDRQKRLALIVALLVPIPFIAIIPFGQIQLPRLDSYIPVVDTVILINDSITATLLLAHFSITRSPSLLALAAGFLFTAFLIVPHALTFPGAFSPNGLLGGGLQTPPWLNEFWHLGLPSAVIAYALLKRTDGVKLVPRYVVPFAIFATVAAAFVLACAVLWVTTKGVELFPAIMVDQLHNQLHWDPFPPAVVSVVAMALLWSRRHSTLDLWLLVVLEAWMLDALLIYEMTARFTLVWYGGRAVAVFTASAVLLLLLSEMTVLYARLGRTVMRQRRDRLALETMTTDLIAARDAAESANRAKSEFLAGMSHEIRTPITCVLGMADLLVESNLTGLQRRHAGLLKDAGQSLLAIIDDLLDISKIEAGKLELDRVPMSAAAVAEGALAIVRSGAAARGLELRGALAADLPPWIEGDPTR